mgnify:CR=1 FL=1
MLRLLNSKIVFGDYLSRLDTHSNSYFKNPLSSNFKILAVIKQSECVPCNLTSNNPAEIVMDVKAIAGIDLPVIYVLDHSSAVEVSVVAENYPDYIVFQDSSMRFCRENNIPDDAKFRFFLLDSANNVALAGNPIQNPKVGDLYIRAICEHLGIERPAASSDSQQPAESHDFGRFPFSETKETEFTFRNESETQMKIDTVFTSCDCTTASIDRMQIEPGGAATLKVRFKTDHPEQFMREIYVQYGGQTRVFTIRGTAE